MRNLRLAREPKQARLRWPVNISIHDADFEADRFQRERKIDSHRRFANAALAGRDSDDVLDARHALRRGLLWLLRLGSSLTRPRAIARRTLGARFSDAGMLFDIGDLSRWSALRLWRRRLLRSALHLGCQHGCNACDALDVADDLFSGLAQVFQFLGAIGWNGDREVGAIVLDQDFGNHSEIDDIAFEVRPLDPAQCLQNLSLLNSHMRASPQRKMVRFSA